MSATLLLLLDSAVISLVGFSVGYLVGYWIEARHEH